MIFLIEELQINDWWEPLHGVCEYIPCGYLNDEEKAKEFCQKGRIYNNTDSSAIGGNKPQFRYLQINKINL